MCLLAPGQGEAWKEGLQAGRRGLLRRSGSATLRDGIPALSPSASPGELGLVGSDSVGEDLTGSWHCGTGRLSEAGERAGTSLPLVVGPATWPPWSLSRLVESWAPALTTYSDFWVGPVLRVLRRPAGLPHHAPTSEALASKVNLDPHCLSGFPAG